jgi:hypothetical protein
MKNNTKKDYRNHLDGLFSNEEIMELTEHCWAGNDKTKKEKQHGYRLAYTGRYGRCLELFDPVAFHVGYNEWKL